MISPIGSFLMRVDAVMLTVMDTGITGLTAYAAAPAVTSLAIFYLIQGVKVANGDGGPVNYFVTRLLRNVMILWFCSRSDIYNLWVRDFFYTSLPNALNKAVLASTLAGMPAVTGVNGTAAAFDQVWALMDTIVNRVITEAPFLDVSSRLAATFASLGGGGALLITAMVYLLSRILMAVLVELGVILIFCLIFPVTQGFFERWLGKVVSLVFLQVTAVVVLQLVVGIERDFMQQIVASHAADVAGDVQALSAMVVMLFMGAFAIYSLPAIAYSIGGGIAVDIHGPMRMGARALSGAAGAVPNLGLAMPAAAATAEREALSLSMASTEIGGGSSGAIAAPEVASLPPPPLSLPSP